MSGEAPELDLPSHSFCSTSSSIISDVNFAENDRLRPKTTGQKDASNISRCVSPPNGVVKTVPAPSTEDTSGGFSLERLLRSWAPHVSLVLENTGSVARDHLANERTWLAYVRTSLSIAGTGVALVQLFTISESSGQDRMLLGFDVPLRRFARPLGAATVLLGLFILGIGVLRYFKIQAALFQGQFPPARGTVVAITATLAGLVAVTFGVLAALPS